jgi:succinoglycan biosynthesis protein ExoA
MYPSEWSPIFRVTLLLPWGANILIMVPDVREQCSSRRIQKIRQLLPLAVLGMNVFSLASGVVFGWPFFLPVLAYIAACMIWGMFCQYQNASGWMGGLAAIIMHQRWAAGFVYRALRPSFSKATFH